jgi:hypothetical protein
MTSTARGPWQPGRGKSIDEAAQHAWENAKNGRAAPGYVAEKAPAGTYKLEIWVEANNPIHTYIVALIPTGP